MKVAICGRGRIGKGIIQQLTALSITPVECVLDPVVGLVARDKQALNNIDLLIVCIAPSSHNKAWHWANVFEGLTKQVKAEHLTINNAILISSTRVYDGIETGIVDASMACQPSSEKAQQLLAGEQMLSKLVNHSAILRCTGLIGEGYEKYQEILSQARDKARFAVDISAVINKVTELVKLAHSDKMGARLALLTDGKVHFEQRALDLSSLEVAKLAERYRILVNSEVQR